MGDFEQLVGSAKDPRPYKLLPNMLLFSSHWIVIVENTLKCIHCERKEEGPTTFTCAYVFADCAIFIGRTAVAVLREATLFSPELRWLYPRKVAKPQVKHRAFF